MDGQNKRINGSKDEEMDGWIGQLTDRLLGVRERVGKIEMPWQMKRKRNKKKRGRRRICVYEANRAMPWEHGTLIAALNEGPLQGTAFTFSVWSWAPAIVLGLSQSVTRMRIQRKFIVLSVRV